MCYKYENTGYFNMLLIYLDIIEREKNEIKKMKKENLKKD